MGDVIKFPSKDDREWQLEVERCQNQLMAELGMPRAETQWIFDRVRNALATITVDVEIPLPDGLEHVASAVNKAREELTRQYEQQIIQLVVEIYGAKFLNIKN